MPLENIYRLLYNRELYLRAYGRLYSNQGAMTKGTTADTVDGMSLAKIDRLIDALRYERFRWTPVRRVTIPKPNGKTRPLGIPTWTDKLLQEVIRMILEAYYEPQFSDRSHGFRPNRGCHTALGNVVNYWHGVRWFVEGDIKGCFDNIDHEVMLSVLGEKLRDNRFLRLLKHLLKAGYLEEWRYGRTLSGTPQGGVVSPILANIYLDRLDKFVENVLIPAHTRGTARRPNPAWAFWSDSGVGLALEGAPSEEVGMGAGRVSGRGPDQAPFWQKRAEGHYYPCLNGENSGSARLVCAPFFSAAWQGALGGRGREPRGYWLCGRAILVSFCPSRSRGIPGRSRFRRRVCRRFLGRLPVECPAPPPVH